MFSLPTFFFKRKQDTGIKKGQDASEAARPGKPAQFEEKEGHPNRMSFFFGADDGNRTRVFSLGS